MPTVPSPSKSGGPPGLVPHTLSRPRKSVIPTIRSLSMSHRHSHSSRMPLRSTSVLVPLTMSVKSGMPLPLQSGSHSSGIPLALRSSLSPSAMSQASGAPLELQSTLVPPAS